MEHSSSSKRDNENALHKLLDENHLVRIHKFFLREESGQLDINQLKQVLHDVAKLDFDPDKFEVVFRKINIKRDGLVTWDEFISHLILNFKNQDVVAEYQDLDPPISKPPRILKSYHRHPINRITFSPNMKPDRSVNFSDGSYVTCSRDGDINYWSLDFSLERSVQSKCLDLKVATTWVTDLVCLPDVSAVCTSSTERDIRFYDTSARKFDIRVIFSSLDYAVCTMHYVIAKDAESESMLLLGDMGGNVKVILFNSLARGPFKSKLGEPLMRARYDALVKGVVPGFRLVEFKNVHSDWVQQVSYYPGLSMIASCAVCPKVSVQLRDLNENKGIYIYKMTRGAYCFTFADGIHLMATGSPDCLVKVWNIFVPRRPSVIFQGHHSGVVSVVFQDDAKILCSISTDKCIKVWDVAAQCCLQTYTGLPSELGEHTDLTVLYNPDTRQLLIGMVMVAIVPLCPTQSGEHTDGNTHCSAISVLLYNPLFEVIVTCGLDSFIIVWDPWKGRRMSVVKEAHIRTLHGKVHPVEITAATFDPGYQLLLTGAHDGSLKTWNFNTGTCMRNMRIEDNCEVTGVVWIKGRILAIGWNRHVTEFADSGGHAGPGGAFSKSWETNHTEDVLCSSARIPQTLVTSSYTGELVMWQLETGQAYKRYNVTDPTHRIKLHYTKEKQSKKFKKANTKKPLVVHLEGPAKTMEHPTAAVSTATSKIPGVKARRLTVVLMPKTTIAIRGLAIRAMTFLSSRPMLPHVGTLLVSLENGAIQVWSHHNSGGFITAFYAIHKGGDYVVSMCTDEQDEYLFTGTTSGYIKTWLMKDYCTGEDVKVCMPLYRVKFPFMWRDLFEGKAKRANRGQEKPTLLNSYRGHRMLVSALAFMDKPQILISASADYSARLWTLSGRYLGTLGTFKKWKPLDPEVPPGDDFEYTIPPDISRVKSMTTFKVLMGGDIPHRLTAKQLAKMQEKVVDIEDYTKGIYGHRLEDPILGNFYHLPERKTHRHEFELDTTFSYIPVYQHMVTEPLNEVPKPRDDPELKKQRVKLMTQNKCEPAACKGTPKH
ncbi:WD repeat-containing protein on Y chromosome [Onthophagus taurus]|uniref:WD repeat-containing protein on Y chromosome n=1 Tax=Onthophagus taurus TaxID=166361 RepID=UPI0039BDEDA7